MPQLSRDMNRAVVLAVFHGIFSEELKVKLERRICDLVLIHGSITLSISVNKLFEDYLRKEYRAWLLFENIP
jgi:hypothetical protein